MFNIRFSIIILLLTFFLPLLCQTSADKQHIQDYKFFTGTLLSPSSHSPLIILREFLMSTLLFVPNCYIVDSTIKEEHDTIVELDRLI